MRKIVYAISIAAAAAFATSATAAPMHYRHYRHYHRYYQPPHVVVHPRAVDTAPASTGAGVVGGTIAGVSVSEGWWSGAAAAALPASAAGAAVVGGVVGMGTVALVDAALEPCRGFAALFDLSHGECVDGQYVGYQEPLPPRHGYRYR